jgi:hypothetical protein
MIMGMITVTMVVFFHKEIPYAMIKKNNAIVIRMLPATN